MGVPVRDLDEAIVAADRDLVRRVLRVVQGHAKLMELADAASTEPGRLEAQLAAAGASLALRSFSPASRRSMVTAEGHW